MHGGGATAHPVQVGVSAIAVPLVCLRHVIVNDDVDTLNVNAAADKVSGHQDALLALLEGLVHLQPARTAKFYLVNNITGLFPSSL